jgi:dephospho-CoA kinase
MVIIGLTGSIAMGKTTAGQAFQHLGVPVHDADQAVHDLLDRNGAAVQIVDAAFPGVARDGGIDRRALGERVFDDPDALGRLEALLHPLVRRREEEFIGQAEDAGHDLVVLDIPLLFETRGEARCDAVVVVSAPPEVQWERALKRPGMTAERLKAILARQMSDGEKRSRADFVIDTGKALDQNLRAIADIVKVIRQRHGLETPPTK